jgi:hypothetical protein
MRNVRVASGVIPLVCILSVLVGVMDGVEAKKKPKPTPCSGRFLAPGTQLVAGATSEGNVATLVVEGTQVALEGTCNPVHGNVKATKNGTTVAARFGTCGSAHGVKLKASIRRDCSSMTGTVKAKKQHAVHFTAGRSSCGDGIVDAGTGEQCEPPATSGCDSSCRAASTTTTVPVGGTTTTTVPTATRFPCPFDQYASDHQIGYSGEDIAGSVTWTKDNLYLVADSVRLTGTLTVQAGTVACFTENFNIDFDANSTGALVVQGTPEQHVVFTAAGAADAYWGGIFFGDTTSTHSRIQNLDIYNGGAAGTGHVIDTYPDSTAAPLDLENLTIYSPEKNGLRNLTMGFAPGSRIVVNNYASESVAEPHFFDGVYPLLEVASEGAATVDDQVIQIGSGVPDAVRFVEFDTEGGTPSVQDLTLKRLASGLRWFPDAGGLSLGTSEDTPQVLTLEPGVVLALNGDVVVGGAGLADIVATGTASDLIVLTSNSFMNEQPPMPGDWGGVVLFPEDFSNASQFAYTVFEFGGGGAPVFNCADGRDDVSAEVVFQAVSVLPADYAGPGITNSTFRRSAGNAIRPLCEQGATCLATDYTMGFGNTFEDFTTFAPQPPLSSKSASCQQP